MRVFTKTTSILNKLTAHWIGFSKVMGKWYLMVESHHFVVDVLADSVFLKIDYCGSWSIGENGLVLCLIAIGVYLIVLSCD